MPTSIFLIRHAAYEHLPSPAGDAASDFGLSQEGRMQAELLAARLRASGEIKPDVFFSSTLPRAVQTAAYLAPVFGLNAVALSEPCEWESGNDALGEAAFKSAWKGLALNARRTHRFLSRGRNHRRVFRPGAEVLGQDRGNTRGQDGGTRGARRRHRSSLRLLSRTRHGSLRRRLPRCSAHLPHTLAQPRAARGLGPGICERHLPLARRSVALISGFTESAA